MCDRWLAKDEDDKKIKRELEVVEQIPLINCETNRCLNSNNSQSVFTSKCDVAKRSQYWSDA